MSKKNKKVFDSIQTWVGADTVFTGDVTTTKSIRIDGKLLGNIKESESVVIGETAEIVGDINTKYIVVSGKVKGNIFAKEGIELLTKSKIIGDLYTDILYVNEGAIFKGKCNMPDESEQQPIEINKKK